MSVLSFMASLTFDTAFEDAKPIVFNPLWANGTGYFDHAVVGVHAPTLSEGEMCSSVSLNNRKIVIVGTRFGNVVVFHRYTDGENYVHVSNLPHEVRNFFNGLLLGGSLSEQAILALLGNGHGSSHVNIGEHFKIIRSMFDKESDKETSTTDTSKDPAAYEKLFKRAIVHLRALSGSRNSFTPEAWEAIGPGMKLRTDEVEGMHSDAYAFLKAYDV